MTAILLHALDLFVLIRKATAAPFWNTRWKAASWNALILQRANAPQANEAGEIAGAAFFRRLLGDPEFEAKIRRVNAGGLRRGVQQPPHQSAQQPQPVPDAMDHAIESRPLKQAEHFVWLAKFQAGAGWAHITKSAHLDTVGNAVEALSKGVTRPHLQRLELETAAQQQASTKNIWQVDS